jgi:hypothetical protein
MPLCIGGPLDSQVRQVEGNLRVLTVPTIVPNPACEGFTIVEHRYNKQLLVGHKGTYPVYVHETVDDPILELIKGYCPSKKSSV